MSRDARHTLAETHSAAAWVIAGATFSLGLASTNYWPRAHDDRNEHSYPDAASAHRPCGDRAILLLEAELMSFTSATKLICVGLNYRDHAAETKLELPVAPLLFAKLANTIIGDGEAIVLPEGVGHVDAEAELAVVIGSRAKAVRRDDALDFVAGYTVANDVSARDIQFSDGQWFRGKGMDTFCPLLDQVVPVSELGAADNLRVVQRLNGQVLQDAPTSDMVFDVPTLVAYVSEALTLEAGDVILTGTPPGVGFVREPPIGLSPGDVVEIEVEGIGCLTNPVTSSPN